MIVAGIDLESRLCEQPVANGRRRRLDRQVQRRVAIGIPDVDPLDVVWRWSKPAASGPHVVATTRLKPRAGVHRFRAYP